MNSSIDRSTTLQAASKRRLRALLHASAALMACGILSQSAAYAVDSTWDGSSDADWNTNTNWSGDTVPDGTATFNNGANNNIGIFVPTSVGGLHFLSTSNAFTITSTDVFTINGAGIQNDNTNLAQTLNITQDGWEIHFTNSATIQGAGTTNIVNQVAGKVIFEGNSSAGNAHITNANGGFTRFQDASSAGSSTIINNDGGQTYFSGTGYGGTANITNNSGGATDFEDSAVAGSSTITNNSGGLTRFKNTSSAGAATITNNSGGETRFQDTATASEGTNGGADITNKSGGITNFNGSSSGGTGTGSKVATITNENGGETDFNDTSGGGTADITNESGGKTFFNDTSGGGSATITNENGGKTIFNQNSSAGSVTVTNEAGGTTYFNGNADGTSSTTIDNQFDAAVDIAGSSRVTGVTIGSLDGAGNVYLGSTKLNVGNSDDHTISGVISDGGSPGSGNTDTGGSLEKIGTGTLTLTGTNTYTGPTTVTAGTLQLDGSLTSNITVNNGGTLSGGSNAFLSGTTGTLLVNNGGTVDPGHGTPANEALFVAGDTTFETGSNFIARVAADGKTNAVVSQNGALNINGGDVTVQAENSNAYGMETTYVLAATLSGTRTGTFDSIDAGSSIPAFLDASLIYLSNAAFLDLRRNATDFQTNVKGLSDNEKAVAKVLDANVPTSSADGFDPLYDSILLAKGNEAQKNALGTASGDPITAFGPAAQAVGERFNDRILNRLFSGWAGAKIAMRPSARMAYTGTRFKSLLAANPDGTAKAKAADAAAEVDAYKSNIWATIAHANENADSDGNGPGFEARATEYQVGWDRKVGSKTVVGVSLGKSDSDIDIDNRNADGNIDTTSVGLYAQRDAGTWYWNGSLSYNRHDIETSRTAGTDHDGDTDGRTIALQGEVGKRYGKGSYRLEPNVSFKWLNTHQDGFTEDGGPGALSVDDASYNTRRLGLGVRIVSNKADARFRPHLSLGYEREFGDEEFELTNQIVGLGSNFTVRGTDLGKNIWNLRLGADARINNRFSLVGEIGASWRKNQDSQYVYGGIKYGW